MLKLIRMYFCVVSTVLFLGSLAFSQEKIDGSFSFQTDPVKRYSLYIPSSYQQGTPNHLVLALHPFHPVWGTSFSWRNVLTDFAEANGLILAVPDGGADGRIDDAIDKAFMTALLDSVENWYTINLDKKFILGFSWGGALPTLMA